MKKATVKCIECGKEKTIDLEMTHDAGREIRKEKCEECGAKLNDVLILLNT